MTSTRDKGFSIKRAVKFNRDKAKSIGWYGRIPANAIEAHQGLALDPVKGTSKQKSDFALAVREFQKIAFKKEGDWDGALGTGTLGKLLKAYNFVSDDERYYLHHEMRLKAPARGQKSRIITYQDPGGLQLRASGLKRRGKPYKLIVLHWSGTRTLKGCKRTMDNHGTSSHFAVTHDGFIYQWKDTERFAEHARGANYYSLGVDMIATAKKSWLDDLTEQGHSVSIMKNTTGRGDKKCLTPDPEMLEATAELILDLCAVYDIPLRSPRIGHVMGTSGEHCYDVLDKGFRYSDEGSGIIGHHHVSSGKWDVAPWWSRIMDLIGLGA